MHIDQTGHEQFACTIDGMGLLGGGGVLFQNGLDCITDNEQFESLSRRAATAIKEPQIGENDGFIAGAFHQAGSPTRPYWCKTSKNTACQRRAAELKSPSRKLMILLENGWMGGVHVSRLDVRNVW